MTKPRDGEPIIIGHDDIMECAERLVRAARQNDFQIATCESCTGGRVGAAITAIPGASAIYVGGMIAYSNMMKAERLNVPRAEIETHGAVSTEVARSMADQGRRLFKADLAISITGIAGPDGGSVLKPVGLVYMGLAKPDGTVTVHQKNYGNIGRTSMQDQACYEALGLLLSEM